jgi:hypothetical protein
MTERPALRPPCLRQDGFRISFTNMSTLHLTSVLLSPVIFAAGAAMWWSTYCDEHKFDEPKHWPTAQALVIDTKNEYKYLGFRRTRYANYAVSVCYSYDIGGTKYVAIQNQFLDRPYEKQGMMTDRQDFYYRSYDAIRIVSEYMKGSISQVHYNPQKPAVSFVDIKFVPGANFYFDQMVAIGFMIFGFIGLLFGATGFDRGY